MPAFLRLCILPILVMAIPVGGHAEDTKHFADSTLGVEFDILPSWKIKQCLSSLPCVEFFDQRYKGVRDPVVSLTIHDGPIEHAAEADSGFFKKNEKWFKAGASTEVEAKSLRTESVSAIYGMGDCGFTDDKGSHSRGGECLEALVTDGKRTAHIQSGFHASPKEVVLYVIRHFRFHQK